MIEKLVWDNYAAFLRQRRATAVHCDAGWDGYRHTVRSKMSEASNVFAEQVSLGEVDCDREVELAKSLRVITVPTVAYYLSGNLVALLPGARQNILRRLERLLQGQSIGREDGLSNDIAAPNFWQL